ASVAKSEHLSRLLDLRGIPHAVLNAKQHAREAHIVAQAGRLHAITVATNMAGRGVDIVLGGNPEGLALQEAHAQGLELGTEEAQATLAELRAKFEEQCRAEGDRVRELGGLYVLGSERHESRRIDNQLRGRSGRQGDPGSSRFFISLEDDLMRIFGPAAERIGRLMDRLEVEPIEHTWVARSIESAQKKVEGMNFDSRKHIVEYDDVMNQQRAIIYAERRKVLEGADTRGNVEDYIRDLIRKGVEVHCEGRHAENWDLAGLVSYLGLYFPLAPGTEIPNDALAAGREGLVEFLHGAAMGAYGDKEEQLTPELMRLAERHVMLRTIDQKWIDYLTAMEHFRESIGLRAYGQRDPLVEYKNEAFHMFGELTEGIQADIVANMFRVQILPAEPAPPPTGIEMGPRPPDGGGNGSPWAARPERGDPVQAAIGTREVAGKVGRNDPCPCGSGQKYKRCHGR
ncbi:MAG: SEC-C metal-binding domain-containing protein, partial [Candidatus Dormibacteraceae bacterium]